MLSYLREGRRVSMRRGGLLPRPESGMRASCPFLWLHLGGGAGTQTVTTAWGAVGRKLLWQVRGTAFGRDRTRGSTTSEGRPERCSPGATHHVPLRAASGTRGRTATAGVLALAANTGLADHDLNGCVERAVRVFGRDGGIAESATNQR